MTKVSSTFVATNTRNLGFIGAVAALALTVVKPGVAGDDHDTARRLSETGDILPLEAVLQHAQAQQPGRVLQVELETEHGRHVYEIEMLDSQGVVWELSFDAQTGALLESERER